MLRRTSSSSPPSGGERTSELGDYSNTSTTLLGSWTKGGRSSSHCEQEPGEEAIAPTMYPSMEKYQIGADEVTRVRASGHSNSSFELLSDGENSAISTRFNSYRRDPPAVDTMQEDVLSRMATLQALCTSGYISTEEFERRKRAIVDELTFASASASSQLTATRLSNGSLRPKEELKVMPHEPDFRHIQPEMAIKHIFDYDSRQWSSTEVYVNLDETPFSKGSLRMVYHLQDLNDVNGDGSYVAKLAMDPEEDPHTYFRDIELQAHCAHYARVYNSYNPPKRVEFIPAWILELTERNGALCAVEPYIAGEYRKHNNNFGSVSDDERNTPQAFSHFTYEASDHELLAVDIQGVGDLYTDPQIHTLNGKDFGKGNLGVTGFQKFLFSHQCNSICRYLKLPPVNPKDRQADSGTVPVQELMNKERVRATHFESRHYYENAPMLQKYIAHCRDVEKKSQKGRERGPSLTSSALYFCSSLLCGCSNDTR